MACCLLLSFTVQKGGLRHQGCIGREWIATTGHKLFFHIFSKLYLWIHLPNVLRTAFVLSQELCTASISQPLNPTCHQWAHGTRCCRVLASTASWQWEQGSDAAHSCSMWALRAAGNLISVSALCCLSHSVLPLLLDSASSGDSDLICS